MEELQAQTPLTEQTVTIKKESALLFLTEKAVANLGSLIPHKKQVEAVHVITMDLLLDQDLVGLENSC